MWKPPKTKLVTITSFPGPLLAFLQAGESRFTINVRIVPTISTYSISITMPMYAMYAMYAKQSSPGVTLTKLSSSDWKNHNTHHPY